MMFPYLFKTEFKVDEKFKAKCIQKGGIWNHTAKEYWENQHLLNLPNFMFRLLFTKW